MRKLVLAFLISIILSLLFTLEVKSEYTYGLGARIGKFATGPNLKWFFDTNGNTGLDFYAGYTREAKSGYFGRVFLMRQLPIMDSRLHIPIDFIYGAGPHVGYFKENYYYIEEGQALYYKSKTFVAGLSLLLGLEWDTERLPITIGIDVIPYYNLLHRGPEWLDMSLSIRYKFR